MRRFLILIVCLVGRVGYGQPVPVIDIDPSGQGTDRGNGDVLWAWYFDVVEPLTVTHLAWFDDGKDGLSHSHNVSLWHKPESQDFSVISSVAIPDGTQAELSDAWRRVPISPLLLTPGDYAIGGTDSPDSTDSIRLIDDDPIIRDYRIVNPEPGASADPMMLPDIVLLIPGFMFGPNFFVEPVPEPSTIVLLVIAVPVMLHAFVDVPYSLNANQPVR